MTNNNENQTIAILVTFLLLVVYMASATVVSGTHRDEINSLKTELAILKGCMTYFPEANGTDLVACTAAKYTLEH